MLHCKIFCYCLGVSETFTFKKSFFSNDFSFLRFSPSTGYASTGDSSLRHRITLNTY